MKGLDVVRPQVQQERIVPLERKVTENAVEAVEYARGQGGERPIDGIAKRLVILGSGIIVMSEPSWFLLHHDDVVPDESLITARVAVGRAVSRLGGVVRVVATHRGQRS